ncbi:MAG: SRPBCC family protein [Candidatus Saccharimonadales bacterium]
MADNNHNLTLRRMLDAPLEKVWQAWADPEQAQKWWGPAGVTNPTFEWDFSTGGKINVVMLAGKELGPMAGQEWPMAGQFKEVTPQQIIVFESSPIMDGQPIMVTLTTVSFEARGGKTELTIDIRVSNVTPEAAGALAGMEQGWNQQTDKLAAFLKEQ